MGRTLGLLLLAASLGAFPLALIAAPDGQTLYLQYCSACHDPGPEHPGTARLSDRWPQQASLLDRKQLDADYVRAIVRHGLNMMPPFRPSEISDRKLKALAAYLAAGPHPQPEDGRK